MMDSGAAVLDAESQRLLAALERHPSFAAIRQLRDLGEVPLAPAPL